MATAPYNVRCSVGSFGMRSPVALSRKRVLPSTAKRPCSSRFELAAVLPWLDNDSHPGNDSSTGRSRMSERQRGSRVR
jgi:hypothetical protein